MNLVLGLLVSLGGVSALFLVAKKGIPMLVDKFGDFFFKIPSVKTFVMAHKQELLELIEACEKELDEDIEALK